MCDAPSPVSRRPRHSPPLLGCLTALTALLSANVALADEDSVAAWHVTPFVEVSVADTGQTIDAGIEAYPSPVSSLGARLLLSVKKGDPTAIYANVSTEQYNFGARVQVFTEFGRGSRRGALLRTPDVSVAGLGLDAAWAFARYEYQPLGYPHQSLLGHSWSLEARGFFFTAIDTPVPVRGAPAGEVVSGSRPAPAPTSYRAWLTEPQLRIGYGRRTTAAEDSYVVRRPNADGVQLAERVKLSPPVVVPSISMLAVVPVAPPNSRFAFAPAARVTFVGGAEQWEPFSVLGRGRLEMWLYYFALEGPTSVRLGIAPYLSTRLYGNESRDSLVGGAVIELRESVSRLEY